MPAHSSGRRRAARWQTAVALVALVVVGAALLAGCALPHRGTGGATARLWVADAAGKRLVVLTAAGGRVASPPVVLGVAPGALAPGPAGSVAVLPLAAGGAHALLHVVGSGTPGPAATTAAWRAGAVPLGEAALGALLAAGGGRHAAVVHHAALGERMRCRLLVLDLAAARRVRAQEVCAPLERVAAVALEETPAGPFVFLAIEQAPPVPGAPPGGRVVAVDAGGGVSASLSLAGIPSHAALGPAHAGGGHRLYVAETLTRPDSDPPTPFAGRLLRLAPETLDAEAAWPLAVAPAHLAIAPDGTPYTLAADTLQRVGGGTAGSGAVRLPERGLALAATDERVYVASAYAGRLWVVDRREERVLHAVPVPGRPSALLLERGA